MNRSEISYNGKVLFVTGTNGSFVTFEVSDERTDLFVGWTSRATDHPDGDPTHGILEPVELQIYQDQSLWSWSVSNPPAKREGFNTVENAADDLAAYLNINNWY